MCVCGRVCTHARVPISLTCQPAVCVPVLGPAGLAQHWPAAGGPQQVAATIHYPLGTREAQLPPGPARDAGTGCGGGAGKAERLGRAQGGLSEQRQAGGGLEGDPAASARTSSGAAEEKGGQSAQGCGKGGGPEIQ